MADRLVTYPLNTLQIHGGRESQDIPRVGHRDGTVCNRNAEPTYNPIVIKPVSWILGSIHLTLPVGPRIYPN